jgi:hypothetical protein
MFQEGGGVSKFIFLGAPPPPLYLKKGLTTNVKEKSYDIPANVW